MMKSFLKQCKTGFGILFYATMIYSLWVSFIFWGRHWDANLHFLSLKICANYLEWLYFSMFAPVYFWFFEKKRKTWNNKEFKKYLRISEQLAILAQRSGYKPLILEKGKFKSIPLSEIFAYMKELAQINILRQVSVGENRYKFFFAEKILKKWPTRPQKYMKWRNFYFGSAVLSLFVLSFFSLIASENIFVSWHQSDLMRFFSAMFNDHISKPQGFGFSLVLLFAASLILGLSIVFEKQVDKWLFHWQNHRRERKLFRFVRKNKGVANSALVCLTMGIPLHRAQDYLNHMQSQGLAQKEFEETGQIFFRFSR